MTGPGYWGYYQPAKPKEVKDGIYSQVQGEPIIKIADKATLDTLTRGTADYIEPASPAPAGTPATQKK